jgi:hypothetical protein
VGTDRLGVFENMELERMLSTEMEKTTYNIRIENTA